MQRLCSAVKTKQRRLLTDSREQGIPKRQSSANLASKPSRIPLQA